MEKLVAVKLDSDAESSHFTRLTCEHSRFLDQVSNVRFFDGGESEQVVVIEPKLLDTEASVIIGQEKITRIPNALTKNFCTFCSSVGGPIKVSLQGISMPPCSRSLEYRRVSVTVPFITPLALKTLRIDSIYSGARAQQLQTYSKQQHICLLELSVSLWQGSVSPITGTHTSWYT